MQFIANGFLKNKWMKEKLSLVETKLYIGNIKYNNVQYKTNIEINQRKLKQKEQTNLDGKVHMLFALFYCSDLRNLFYLPFNHA